MLISATSEYPTLSDIPDPFAPYAVLHKKHAWLTKATVVNNLHCGEFVLRGYVSSLCLLSNERVWGQLDPESQDYLVARKNSQISHSLDCYLAEAALSVHEFLNICVTESLTPNLQKLCDTWQRGGLDFEKLQESLHMLLDSLRVEARRRAVAFEISNGLNLAEYPQSFIACSKPRKIIAVLGPTNSGKTYEAFERLALAKSGVYLGPLRLLALEAFNRLNNEFGVKTSLVTGEERRLIPGSRITSSTVEMLNTHEDLEVAVIDEVQLLKDPERGWAWTQAIVGANASELWLLGAQTAEPAIQALAKQLGLPLEIRRKTRKNGLYVSRTAIAHTASEALTKIEPGDALIVFSRQDALNLRDDLLQKGRTVACIYGALSPEVREREAARFSNGDAEILVATDAVGMGLNLPIKRVIFTAVKKWNGDEVVSLETPLLQQIGGRAGRFGLNDEEGVVSGLTPAEHAVVRTQMHIPQENLPSLGLSIGASSTYLNFIASLTGESRLEVLLSLFSLHSKDASGMFKSHVSVEQLDRAGYLDKLTLTLEKKVVFSQAPMDSRHLVIDGYWKAWAKACAQGKKVRLEYLGNPSVACLDDAETALRVLSGYKWMAYRVPDVFVDEDLVDDLLADWVSAVDGHLRSRRKQGTSGGTVSGQPSWYHP